MDEKQMERRSFLKYTAAVAVGASSFVKPTFAAEKVKGATLRKAVQIGMLPKKISDSEKFKLAKSCGYEGIEANPLDDLKAAAEQGKLARDAGVPIHSIVYGGWKAPLSDPNQVVQEKGREGVVNALHCAREMGADTVLLVPAKVTEDVSYADAYKRSQENIRKLIPWARQMGVVIAVENVWNKFLLSPIEFARYVDEFESPWVRAYFDVGNVILFGYSQDWIRTLGKRICKIHLKDFKRKGYKWVNLMDGDVNWPEVRKALDEVGYDGYLTPELGRNKDEAYLRDLSGRIDKILAM